MLSVSVFVVEFNFPVIPWNSETREELKMAVALKVPIFKLYFTEQRLKILTCENPPLS
jgi:hypothetical protein